MSSKQHSLTGILSNILIIIALCIFLVCTGLFFKGQFDANIAIVEAGKAISSAVASDNANQAAIDYTGAITYLEAAQQAYSENSVMKITSLIYTLATTVILGYGAKVLHLASSDKQELCEEILNKTENQLTMLANQRLQQQNDIYTAITACETASHLCFLLQSNIALSEQLKSANGGTNVSSQVAERFQIELNWALQRLLNFLISNQKDDSDLFENKAHIEIITQSWNQAKKSIDEYIMPEGDNTSSCLGKVFGKYDQLAIERLVDEIQEKISMLE